MFDFLKKKNEPNNHKLIKEALFEAWELHDSTNQEYDGHPYSTHIMHVFQNVVDYIGYFPEEDWQAILFGASFHDSIEDARLTYNDVMKIAKKYMSDDKALIATEIVYALTNEKGRNRAERANDKYYEGIRTTQYAPFVKLADRLANMKYSINKGSSMADKYRNELPHFLESITSDSDDIRFKLPQKMVEKILSL